MTLIDTGPLFALVNRTEPDDQRAIRNALLQRDRNYATTLAAMTEALYLAYKIGGWPMQQQLWQLHHVRAFRIIELTANEIDRCRELMFNYRSMPMDFADATLVAVAESTDTRQVVSIDSDFYVYRLYDDEAFDVINPLA